MKVSFLFLFSIILPFIIWLFNFGFIGTFICVFCYILFVWFSNLSKTFGKNSIHRKNNDNIILETITISHYCEKVRWCMDLLKINYHEEHTAGILGIISLGRTVPTLILPNIPLSIGNSSNILRYLYGEYYNKEEASFLKPLSHLLELEKKIDRMGVSIQRVLYYYILPYKKICCTLWGETVNEVPKIQRLLLPILFPLLRIFLIKGLIINEDIVKKEKLLIEEVLDEMDELLSDGRKYINGKSLTFVDITFSSLSAPLVIPRITNYAGGKADQTVTQFPQNLEEELIKLNEKHKISFNYVKNIYKEYR